MRLRVPRQEADLLGAHVAVALGRREDFDVARVVDGGVTATGVLSRERGNLITICNTL